MCVFFIVILSCLILRSYINFLPVDASQAGEGQLEISINEGEVPNHVQVVGGGRCLVSFTPEQTKPHLIDIKFNGETVTGELFEFYEKGYLTYYLINFLFSRTKPVK